MFGGCEASSGGVQSIAHVGICIRNLTMKVLLHFNGRTCLFQLVPVVFILLAPVLTCCKDLVQPVDCSDIHQQDKSLNSGVYTIYPLGERSAVQVYCDMDTDGGGWTVFQRRMDGTVNFYRPWDQYKIGFGDAAGEHWLGLDVLHYLTRRQTHQLLVEMEDFTRQKVSAGYSQFSVGSECHGYKLSVSGFTNGGAGDSLSPHNGNKFSTFDKDQDVWHKNCAKSFLGAFWYGACHRANPNGVYRWGADGSIHAAGVDWYHWKGYDYSLKAISMKIRPVL
ncbi:microfibril-associated glycoprotein 4-like isoform X1 [Sphaeramia orbicularis]|uniref:microfibril-associated glycoprotein 4-like isoform X1 n=1 Tax=Sphaeramia orbicularis TaxID=375764 RepID=UPI00117D3208|nr:microfibril-associated glycoprotein 4-like isoform X1 [Sphaeramia orbicularis]